jgi:CheY-like chemotaxis protein/chromosome segregation ATPase
MSTKVLVFESDSAFASELRNELGNLGCATTVVEDGNLGLQQAAAEKPDLILLSIELPRMNGFSVCNKLKKDPSLKDIPLIIMSSESSEETFEQHKKLRTRAEDYVHKPVAFGELLQHIQSFVPLGAPSADPEGVIVIDDEIEVGSTDYVIEDDDASATVVAKTSVPPDSSNLDRVDVDAFAESAFGRITAPGASEGHATGNGSLAATERSRAPQAKAPMPPPRGSVAPPTARGQSVRPPVVGGVDPVEHERLRDDLARAQQRLGAADAEFSEARREIEKLRIEAGDAERLAREVDELKAKLAAGTKAGGGISSRDFLDLREALNKKDKEILSLKEQISKKDREIVESQERGIAAERAKADNEERLLTLERDLAETKEKNEALATDKDLAKKASDDLRARLDKARVENETRERQLQELRTKTAEERAAGDAKLAAARADLDQELANERAAQARLLDEADARRVADLAIADRDRNTAIAEARERAEQAKRDALGAQASQLKQEHQAALAALEQAHAAETNRLRTDAAEAARDADEKSEKALADATKEAEERLTQTQNDAERRHQAALAELKSEHAALITKIETERDSRLATLENDRAASVAALEAKASRELGESNDKLAKLEMDLAAIRGELQSLRETKEAGDTASAARIAELEAKLAEVEGARDDLSAKFQNSAARVGVLEGDLAGVQGDLERTREKLASESERAHKATAKWDADKQSLERAKDALAVALAQIEEAEGRS